MRKALIFISFTSILPNASLFAHTAVPRHSHIDVYKDDTPAGAYDLSCPPAPTGDGTYTNPGGPAAGGLGVGDYIDIRTGADGVNTSTVTIDYAKSAPSTDALIVIRQEEWAGVVDNCGVAQLDLTIKRVTPKSDGTTEEKNVRIMRFSNLQPTNPADKCPINFCVKWD